MFPRSHLLLKMVCLVAGVALLYQAGRLIVRGDPLANVRIPQLPSLTNAVSSTNTAPAAARVGTNTVSTNARPAGGVASATNLTGSSKSNAASLAAASIGTNAASGSNTLAETVVRTVKNTNASTSVASKTRTNVTGSSTSNAVPKATAAAATGTNATNQVAMPGARPARVGGPAVGPPMGGASPRGPAPPLPKEIQARVDRITDSELLAPVMRPLPMALLGIGGEHVFLRAANGQTGLVKVGDSLGGIKLLKIGINRVLVEEDGQSKELTIFSGMGGESLMSESKPNPQ